MATKEEIAQAVEQFQRELTASVPALEKILDTPKTILSGYSAAPHVHIWNKAIIKPKRGREIEVQITYVEDDGFMAQKFRGDNDPRRLDDPVAYFCSWDGSVYRQRWGTGRNQGECNSSEKINSSWRIEV